jgi:hypothetical protein
VLAAHPGVQARRNVATTTASNLSSFSRTAVSYFGPGVGDIATEPNYSGGEQEKEELVNVVKLTPGSGRVHRRGIEADKHARKESTVFASSDPAKRS